MTFAAELRDLMKTFMARAPRAWPFLRPRSLTGLGTPPKGAGLPQDRMPMTYLFASAMVCALGLGLAEGSPLSLICDVLTAVVSAALDALFLALIALAACFTEDTSALYLAWQKCDFALGRLMFTLDDGHSSALRSIAWVAVAVFATHFVCHPDSKCEASK